MTYHLYKMFGLFGASAPTVPTYPELTTPASDAGTSLFVLRKVAVVCYGGYSLYWRLAFCFSGALESLESQIVAFSATNALPRL